MPDLILRTVQHEDVVGTVDQSTIAAAHRGRDDAGPPRVPAEGHLDALLLSAAAQKARAFAGAGDDGGTLTHPLVTTLTQRMVTTASPESVSTTAMSPRRSVR